MPHVTNPAHFRASFCDPNRDDVNWRRVCGESSRGDDSPASWWWTCEYRQFVASLPCAYVDSDYRGKVKTTKGGRECQAWSAQYPKVHTRTHDHYPLLYSGCGWRRRRRRDGRHSDT